MCCIEICFGVIRVFVVQHLLALEALPSLLTMHISLFLNCGEHATPDF